MPKRPCFCGLANAKARLTVPVHSLWPDIRDRVPSGANLFVDANRRNFIRRMMAIMARIAAPKDSRYSSHAFRRGSAQEMNETARPYRPSPRLVLGAPTRSMPTLSLRLTWKRMFEICPVFILNPNRTRRRDLVFGLRGESPSPARIGRFTHGYRGFCRPIPPCLLSNSSGAG